MHSNSSALHALLHCACVRMHPPTMRSRPYCWGEPQWTRPQHRVYVFQPHEAKPIKRIGIGKLKHTPKASHRASATHALRIALRVGNLPKPWICLGWNFPRDLLTEVEPQNQISQGLLYPIITCRINCVSHEGQLTEGFINLRVLRRKR